ncbi:hypothetical protein IMG5_126240 [Ichthyophthirius multifiliis]|uniref:Uncharacterized protein n=1 Tax=Ichthyophthirius multifiliis TaxID=5932 RepID=G0QVT0_ICHMU|nr:hypothetical protein IMG5_126240 [Ichthyophthirius multifiliis]EGR30668.1 hypothetical protein IMG5_126240 [Ichthyophthirius multifiliis]|eukprot:XP_004032255.1 hypothetical protein IMG5_126240 [Ichthyophthirius multifiliis]
MVRFEYKLYILKYSLVGQSLIKIDCWDRNENEKRKLYHETHPDTYKVNNDLDKYNLQSKNNLSPNYAILIFRPYMIEHSCFIMPQVIANGRKQFESIFKPYKKNQKFIHQIEKNEWKVYELNP